MNEPAPIPPLTAPLTAAARVAPPRYWKSLPERNGDQALTEAARDEFPPPPTEEEMAAAGSRGGRREFLKLTGFLLAGGLFGGLVRPRVEKAIPYQTLVEYSVGGCSYWYAGMCGACPAGCGLLAKVRDGRPIKLEGNPDHPLSQGGLCAVGQASILGLYDSRRALKPTQRGQFIPWAQLDADVSAQFNALHVTGGVRLLTGTETGPTMRREIARFMEPFADARHIQYDPLSCNAILDAHAATHGARVLPRYRLDRADVIASFDADFLGTWISPVEFTKAYAAKRVPTGSGLRATMSHHTQFEARLSLTGARADDRYLLHPTEMVHALGQLAVRVCRRAAIDLPIEPSAVALPDAAFDAVADRLWSARGRSLVLCGINDSGCQLLTNIINDALDNYGTTVDAMQPSQQRRGDDSALDGLLVDMEAGKVQALIIAGVNPVYDLPSGARWAQALKKVPLTIGCADRIDETVEHLRYHCPEPHWLEAWRDAESVAGIVTLGQPAMRRLGQTRTLVESLAAWRGVPANNYAIVQDAWREQVFPRQTARTDFDIFWDRTVERGFAVVTPSPAAIRDFTLPSLPTLAAPATGLYLVAYASTGLFDGREAENPWLQELPDPITKTSWEQCASLAPDLAARLGITNGDTLRLSAGGTTLEAPAYIQPGMHPAVIAVPRGYGRKGTERFVDVGPQWISAVARLKPGERLGQAVAPLLSVSAAAGSQFTAIEVTRTGASRELACTQQHNSLKPPAAIAGEHAAPRPMVRELTLADLQRGDVEDGERKAEPSLWSPDHPYTGNKWGMAIDLTRCTGCAGCVVACQVENNIPVVGWDEVRRGREMHWLRIDRYFSDRAEGGVDVVQQPMLCQHCDHAPCEVVCPVLATVHSAEGINQQVYNRCIGTRYCANNCPYKVRRFNWFGYAHDDTRANLVLNPDVTVRSSGVMEKCSFCIQRVQEAKAEVQRLGRPLADGDIQTACQQSCPADAITFGNLNDPESAVSKMVRDSRGYQVLADIGTRPAITYLQIVRHRSESKA